MYRLTNENDTDISESLSETDSTMKSQDNTKMT